jgi:uncharacterized membrane protein YkoI
MSKQTFINNVLATLLTFLIFAPVVLAKHHKGAGLENCLQAASSIKSGVFVKVEFLNPSAQGMPTYEIEVRDAKGTEWEFMCDAKTGLIYEIEQEVDSSAEKRFSKHKKVSEEDARAAALEVYPGEIREREYEIESDGSATYEFDVVGSDGTEFKVEVDAASGKIIEVAVEQWQIGEEQGEEK